MVKFKHADGRLLVTRIKELERFLTKRQRHYKEAGKSEKEFQSWAEQWLETLDFRSGSYIEVTQDSFKFAKW